LDQAKSNQKIKTEKSFCPQADAWPAFLSANASLIVLLATSFLFLNFHFFQRRQTASGKSGQNTGGLACRKKALEILQKGWIVRTKVGQNIPACVVLNTVRMACAQKAFCR
jgi:hypothetical protein